MGTWKETFDHAGRAAASMMNSRSQTATAIGALTVPALLSPTAAIVSGTAGVLLLASHLFGRNDPMKAPRAAAGLPSSDGIYVVGKDMEGADIKLGSEEILRPRVVFGDTAMGKTEVLLGMAASHLERGAGMIFVDGKGDPALIRKVEALASSVGRKHDFLHLDVSGRKFASSAFPCPKVFEGFITWGGPHVAVKFLEDILGEASPDARIWRGRTMILAEIASAAHHLFTKDSSQSDKSAAHFLAMAELEAVIRLAHPDLPHEETSAGSTGEHSDDVSVERIHKVRIPAPLSTAASNYLSSIPGYDPDRGLKQAASVREHHGFIRAEIASAVAMVGEIGGLTVGTDQDFHFGSSLDRNEIIVVTLPNLARSGASGQNAGRIVAARIMQSLRILKDHDGNGRKAKEPPVVILDEVGHYATPGLENLTNEARRQGFSLILADRDVDDFTRTESGRRIAAKSPMTFTLKSAGPIRFRYHGAELDVQPVHADEALEAHLRSRSVVRQ